MEISIIYIYTDRYVVFKWNDVQFILFTEIKKKKTMDELKPSTDQTLRFYKKRRWILVGTWGLWLQPMIEYI